MSKVINLMRKCFTQAPNAVIIDPTLSDGAVRLFFYMSSKSENWSFNNADIKRQLSIKRDETIAKYFKELMRSGWISRTARMKNNRPSGFFDYTLYFEPIIPANTKDADLLNNATTINADTGKPQLPQNSSYTNTEFGNNTKQNNTPLIPIEKNNIQTFEGDDWLKIINDRNLTFTDKEKSSIKSWGNEFLRVKLLKNKSVSVDCITKGLDYLFQCKSEGFDIALLIEDSIEHSKGFLFRPTYRYLNKLTFDKKIPEIDTYRRYPCADYISPRNTSEKRELCGYLDRCYRNKIDPRTGLALTIEQMSLLRAHFSQEIRGYISIYEYIYQEEVLKNVSLLEQSINGIPASFVNVKSNKSDSHNKDE